MSGPLELRFVTSADRVDRLPSAESEVAIVGRSNVGKSSLVNALSNRRKLAHVSNTPGRTRLLNLFAVGAGPDPGKGSAKGTAKSAAKSRGKGSGSVGSPLGASVMDLPGYGYAKASKQLRDSWGRMIEDYLLEREELVMVMVLVDGEIGPTKLDAQML